MKKILFFIILMMPFFVFAENEVVIKSIEPVYDTTSGIVYSEIDGNRNVVFSDLDQTFQYKIVIENTTEDELKISDIDLTNSPALFMDYSYEKINTTQSLKPSEEKEFLINLKTLSNRGVSQNYEEEVYFDLAFERVVEEALVENPVTSDSMIKVLVLFVISGGMLILFHKYKVSRYVTMVSLLLFCGLTVNAEELISLNLKTSVKFNSPNVLKTGTYTAQYRADAYFANTPTYLNVYISNKGVIPEGYVSAEDISAEQNGKVMAYKVANADNSTLYDLHIVANGKIYANEESCPLFNGFTRVEKIDNLSGINFSKCKNMGSLFDNTRALKELNLTNFDTSSATDMSYMFNMTGIENLDLSSFNTSKVTDMTYMLSSMYIKSLDVSDFDTSNVLLMRNMFIGSNELEGLDVSNFDFSKVTNLENMFNDTGKDVTDFYLDLSGYDFTGDAFDSVVGMFDALDTHKIYVKNETTKQWILNKGYTGLSTANVIVGSCTDGVCTAS